MRKYVALIPLKQKLYYIHNNPVIDKIAANLEDYVLGLLVIMQI